MASSVMDPSRKLHGCLCECGTKVRGTFARGHDARWLAPRIFGVRYGHLDRAQTLEEIRQVSEGLAARFERHCPAEVAA